MSGSNCCFLTCMQVSQEAGQVVWSFHPFNNFSQFLVIHAVKGFSVASESEVNVFLELSCFFDDPMNGGNLVSSSSAFSKSESLNTPQITFVNITASLVRKKSLGIWKVSISWWELQVFKLHIITRKLKSYHWPQILSAAFLTVLTLFIFKKISAKQPRLNHHS